MTAAFPTRWTILLLAALAVVGAARRAEAQGQSFAQPISTESLDRSLGRYAKPSPEARAAIEKAHDEYLDAYRRLQDAELEPFARERPPMLTGGDMGAWMRRYTALRGRVIGLDTTLFESIRLALPEAQQAGVDRIRWVREAEVLRTGILGDMTGGFGGPSRTRLSDLVFSAGLSEEDLAAVDPILRDHEQRHLAAIRRSVDESERLITDFGDRMKKAGLWGEAFEQAQKDPEQAVELYRRMSGMIKETFTAVLEEGAKVGDSTRKGYTQVRDGLSWDGRLKLVPAWLSGAYPSVSGHYPKMFAMRVERAKKLVGEHTAAASTIDRIHRETMDRAVAALDAACKAEDAFQSEMMLTQFSIMEEGGADARSATMQRQQEERQKLIEQIQRAVAFGDDAIRAQLPAEVAEKLNAPDAPATVDGTAPPVAATEQAVAIAAAEGDAEAVETGYGGFEGATVTVDTVPHQLRPYSVASLQRFLTAIGASDEQRTMIETLHGDYLARHTETVAPKRTAYDEARMNQWQVQEEGPMRLDPSKAERSAGLLRDLAAATRSLDEELFASMAAALGEKHANAVRVERLGRVTGSIGCVGQQMWVFAPNAEQPVDVVAVMRDAALSDAEQAAVLAALAPHADAIESAAQRSFEALVEAQLRMERLQSDLFPPGATPEDQAKAAMEWQKRSTEVLESSKPALDERRRANLAALDAVSKALGEQSRAEIQRQWSQASYPTVFRDRRALFETIKKVEKLSDLTPAQTELVRETLEEYRTAYEIACDAMLAASMKSLPEPKDGQMSAEYWMGVQDRERSISRMRFERDETSARAASKLRQILTPEQLAQFPVLADPSKTKARTDRNW